MAEQAKSENVLDLVSQLEKFLPKELVAQLKLPKKQEALELATDDSIANFFDAGMPTKAGGVDTASVAKQIGEQSQLNIETDAKKKKRLEAEAEAGAASARARYKASSYTPTIPLRYSGKKR